MILGTADAKEPAITPVLARRLKKAKTGCSDSEEERAHGAGACREEEGTRAKGPRRETLPRK